MMAATGVEQVMLKSTDHEATTNRSRNILIATAVVLLLLAILGITLGLTLGLQTDNKPTNSPPGSRVYDNAAVVTDYGPCSDVGRNILLAGGSAVDAAIAAALCLGVASPQSSGMGGGFFMVVYDAEGKTAHSLIANEIAPAASTFDMFVNDTDEASSGARSVSVPTEVAGLWEAHQAFGVLPWKTLFEPVIALAQGYPFAWHTEYCLKIYEKDDFSNYPILKELYTYPNGSLFKTGDIVEATASQMRTLRAIADDGVSAFYGGEVGQMLVEDIRDQGGIITTDDIALTGFDIKWWHNVSAITLKDELNTITSTSVASSGNLMQFTINVLSECNMSSVDLTTFAGKLKMYHYFIEASSFAVGLRRHLGYTDTDEVIQTVSALLSTDYARHICSLINETYVTFTSMEDYDTYSDLPPPSSPSRRETRTVDRYADEIMVGDTSHLSVVAKNGDAVSLTTSVGSYFGSKVYSNKTGLFLNNHMSNFYYDGRTGEWLANKLGPGARAMSTIGPSVVTGKDGALRSVIGASGGLRIISTDAWVILKSLWGKDDISDIIDAPRVYAYPDIISNTVYYEEDFSEDLLAKLREMGHNMQYTSSFAACQAIVVEEDRSLHAYCDPRKKGYPAGY